MCRYFSHKSFHNFQLFQFCWHTSISYVWWKQNGSELRLKSDFCYLAVFSHVMSGYSWALGIITNPINWRMLWNRLSLYSCSYPFFYWVVMGKMVWYVLIYIVLCIVYGSICFLSYFDSYTIGLNWPEININLIKNYPEFEGANILKW